LLMSLKKAETHRRRFQWGKQSTTTRPGTA
jgi:hypothetical protein